MDLEAVTMPILAAPAPRTRFLFDSFYLYPTIDTLEVPIFCDENLGIVVLPISAKSDISLVRRS